MYPACQAVKMLKQQVNRSFDIGLTGVVQLTPGPWLQVSGHELLNFG
jgi:hypothetical protein